jgi:hypothetical protein
MVTRRAKNGTYYEEPPYTEEEELAIYHALCGGDRPIVTLHGPRPVATSQTPDKKPPPSPEE